MSHPHIDDRNWPALTLGERIRQIEVEGYLLIPDLLTPEHVTCLRAETAKLETTPVDYSVHQRGCPNIQFRGGSDHRVDCPPPHHRLPPGAPGRRNPVVALRLRPL